MPTCWGGLLYGRETPGYPLQRGHATSGLHAMSKAPAGGKRISMVVAGQSVDVQQGLASTPLRQAYRLSSVHTGHLKLRCTGDCKVLKGQPDAQSTRHCTDRSNVACSPATLVAARPAASKGQAPV